MLRKPNNCLHAHTTLGRYAIDNKGNTFFRQFGGLRDAQVAVKRSDHRQGKLTSLFRLVAQWFRQRRIGHGKDSLVYRGSGQAK
ncbi:hypothetical protein CR159_08530 [Pollutimonas subterranea]|uniref:Uncharacterized protein n=1 Tax=Pollutimonas subterranea TaxID=2045210 RepID=A0A2N4U639_9BURK|nr:hypothetical protein CR159_08530 [Pollutimonas subterranea]